MRIEDVDAGHRRCWRWTDDHKNITNKLSLGLDKCYNHSPGSLQIIKHKTNQQTNQQTLTIYSIKLKNILRVQCWCRGQWETDFHKAEGAFQHPFPKRRGRQLCTIALAMPVHYWATHFVIVPNYIHSHHFLGNADTMLLDEHNFSLPKCSIQTGT